MDTGIPFGAAALAAWTAAADHARQLGHEYVGTEHVLLGLLQENPELFRHLRVNGKIEDVVLAMLERRPPLSAAAPGGAPERARWDAHRELPITPSAVRTLELSIAEARRTAAAVVEPRHIAVGLVQEGEDIAAAALREMGIASPEDLNGPEGG